MKRILALMDIRTIKMIFSIRNELHIAHNLSSGSLKFTKINLDTNYFVKKDVEAFIRYRVNELGWDTNLKESEESPFGQVGRYLPLGIVGDCKVNILQLGP